MKNIVIILFFLLPDFIFGQTASSFQRTYGRVGYNYGRCAYQTKDGGYIILGNSSGYEGNTSVYLAKTDTLGKIIWDKLIGGTEINWANDFKITHDKGYIIAGYTNLNSENGYDVLLIKTDSSGKVLWKKTYGGTDWDLGYSVIEDKEHNFLVAGSTYSYSYEDADVYLIKTDSAGDTLWTRHYGGIGEDAAYCIDTTNHSDYLLSGVTRKETDSTYDAYLLKINKNGDTLFTKKYGDTLDDKFYCARQIDETDYIVCGTTQNYGAKGYDQWILKLDTLGNVQWTRVFVNAGNEELFDIKQDWQHNFVTTGYTTTYGAGAGDVTATMYSNDGWFVNGGNYGGPKYDVSYSINFTKDSGYICTGTTYSYGIGISNIYFIKTDKTFHSNMVPTAEVDVIEIKAGENFSCSAFPNPTSGLLKININNEEKEIVNFKIFNIIGEEIFADSFKSINSYYSKTIDISNFADGVYIVQISDNKYTSSLKIIKK